MNRLLTALLTATLLLTGTTQAAFAAGAEAATPRVTVAPAALKRGAALPALYVSLAALQVADVMSTRGAMKLGAVETNPLMKPFAGSTGGMLALKAATTAGSILLAERVGKKNKAAAIAVMIAANVVTAAAAAQNMRVAKRLR